MGRAASAARTTGVRDDELGLRIAHSGEAAVAHRHLSAASNRVDASLRRLASGLRVNSAADDAAGLSIAESMRSQVRGLEMAQRNVQDGISMLAVMDGALSEVHAILQRSRELAVQYNNLEHDPNARQAILDEWTMLSNEVARIEQTTEFNGLPLLQSATTLVTLQVGANVGDTIAVSLVDLFGAGLNLVRSVSFGPLIFLDADITAFDQHITDVAIARGRIGAISNRLEHTMNANAATIENLMSAESRIRDVDFAAEMTELTRSQIVQQSATSMLALANQSSARVLDLLR